MALYTDKTKPGSSCVRTLNPGSAAEKFTCTEAGKTETYKTAEAQMNNPLGGLPGGMFSGLSGLSGKFAEKKIAREAENAAQTAACAPFPAAVKAVRDEMTALNTSNAAAVAAIKQAKIDAVAAADAAAKASLEAQKNSYSSGKAIVDAKLQTVKAQYPKCNEISSRGEGYGHPGRNGNSIL